MGFKSSVMHVDDGHKHISDIIAVISATLTDNRKMNCLNSIFIYIQVKHNIDVVYWYYLITVSYNGRMRQFIILDAKGITIWKKDLIDHNGKQYPEEIIISDFKIINNYRAWMSNSIFVEWTSASGSLCNFVYSCKYTEGNLITWLLAQGVYLYRCIVY